MKLKFASLAVAMAIAGLVAAPLALAAPPPVKAYTETVTVDVDNDVSVDISKLIEVVKEVATTGTIRVDGDIEVNGSSMAVIDNKQVSDSNTADSANRNNEATVHDAVADDAAGNVGINITAGDNNVQDNATAITNGASANPADNASVEAEIFAVQDTTNNSSTSTGTSVEAADNYTQMDNALNGAAGNVGVNMSTGNSNLQKNALSIATASDSVLSEATTAVLQQASTNTTTNAEEHNTADIAANALNLAQGNLGVNITAGTNNVQANTMAIASAGAGGGAGVP